MLSLCTVMYPAYAKWIKSHRDLPLKLNQWNNVVVCRGTCSTCIASFFPEVFFLFCFVLGGLLPTLALTVAVYFVFVEMGV